MGEQNQNDGAGEPDLAAREMVISRVLNAPPGLVYRVWVSPEHVVQWWGPKGFTTTTHSMDVRPGGVWRFVMHGPDGTDYPNRIVFNEVVPGERLAYTHGGGQGGLEGLSFETTVTFEAHAEGKTKLTMRSVFPTPAERLLVITQYEADIGGMEHLTRLADYVSAETGDWSPAMTVAMPSETEVVIRRNFAAPRRLVFEAMTKPEHVRN